MFISRGTVCLCSRLSFQECLYTNKICKIQCLSTLQRVGLFTVHDSKDKIFFWDIGEVGLLFILKDFGSLRSGLLRCDAHPMCVHLPGLLHITLIDFGVKGN